MTRRILLCDDEVHILRAAEFKFKRAGYEVLCASDGEQGWQLINERAPDIVVTDCQMPRLSGLQLAQRLMQHPTHQRIPIVMLTAKGFELSPSELREQFGILALLDKPFSPRDLFTRVEEILDDHAAIV